MKKYILLFSIFLFIGAVYPIKHATGLTFGYNGYGGSFQDIEDRISGSQFTGFEGTGEAIVAYGAWRTAVKYKFNVYLHSDLSQLANGVTDESIAGGTSGREWREINFTSTPTFSAVDYVLVAWSESFPFDVIDFAYDDGDGTTQGHYDVETYNGFPNPMVATHEDRKYSIYATYTAGGASDTCTPDNTGVWAIDLTDNCTTSEDFYSDFGVECYNSGIWAITEGTTVRVASSTNCMPNVRGSFIIQ